MHRPGSHEPEDDEPENEQRQRQEDVDDAHDHFVEPCRGEVAREHPDRNADEQPERDAADRYLQRHHRTRCAAGKQVAAKTVRAEPMLRRRWFADRSGLQHWVGCKEVTDDCNENEQGDEDKPGDGHRVAEHRYHGASDDAPR